MARERVTTEDLIVGAESLLDRVRGQLKRVADKVKRDQEDRGPAAVQSGESTMPTPDAPAPDSAAPDNAAPKTVRMPPGQAEVVAEAEKLAATKAALQPMEDAKTVTGEQLAREAEAAAAARKFEAQTAVAKATAAADSEPTEDAIARKGAIEQLVDLEDTSDGDLDGIEDLLGEVDALIDGD